MFRNLIKSFIISFLIAASTSLIIGSIASNVVSDYKLERDKMLIKYSNTLVLDNVGNKIGEFRTESKSSNKYDEIPQDFIQAAVATEDREFFEHSGLDLKSIFRAMIINLQSKDYSQGGSTITQQLVKQIYLDPGKTLERKKNEAVLSTILEESFTKKELMAHYLNHNFYGNNTYGLENALQTYYGQNFNQYKKDKAEDRAAKAALLVAIPNAPSLFNPYNNPDDTLKRRNSVLTNMYVEGYISKKTYEKSKNKSLLVLDNPKRGSDKQFVTQPEMVTAALNESASILDLDVEDVMYGGYRIETTFDKKMYDIVRKHISYNGNYPHNPNASEGIQASTVFVNPQNGQIYAMTGNKNTTKEILTFNRATQAKRQPGSSLKPLISYGPALESGKFGRYSQLSCKSDYNGYKVRDYGCYGSPTMNESIRVSLNAPAVWTLEQVGVENARKYVKKLGINLSKDDVYLPMALGGLEQGVTALELSDAYQAYASKGKRQKAHSVTKITDPNGKVVHEAGKPKQVIDANSADEMKGMLREVVRSGTGKDAHIPGLNVGGKTGTNETKDGRGNTDLWFVGLDDRIVGSVWMGYDKTEGNNYIPSGKMSTYPAKLFSKIGRELMPEINQLPRNSGAKTLDVEFYTKVSTKDIELEWEHTPGTEYIIYKDGVAIEKAESGVYLDEFVELDKKYEYKIEGYDTKTGNLKVTSKTKVVNVS